MARGKCIDFARCPENIGTHFRRVAGTVPMTVMDMFENTYLFQSMGMRRKKGLCSSLYWVQGK